MYRRRILRNVEDKPELVARLDLTSSEQDRVREVLSFYKRQDIDWASPFSVRLKGTQQNHQC